MHACMHAERLSLSTKGFPIDLVPAEELEEERRHALHGLTKGDTLKFLRVSDSGHMAHMPSITKRWVEEDDGTDGL